MPLRHAEREEENTRLIFRAMPYFPPALPDRFMPLPRFCRAQCDAPLLPTMDIINTALFIFARYYAAMLRAFFFFFFFDIFATPDAII